MSKGDYWKHFVQLFCQVFLGYLHMYFIFTMFNNQLRKEKNIFALNVLSVYVYCLYWNTMFDQL